MIPTVLYLPLMPPHHKAAVWSVYFLWKAVDLSFARARIYDRIWQKDARGIAVVDTRRTFITMRHGWIVKAALWASIVFVLVFFLVVRGASSKIYSHTFTFSDATFAWLRTLVIITIAQEMPHGVSALLRWGVADTSDIKSRNKLFFHFCMPIAAFFALGILREEQAYRTLLPPAVCLFVSTDPRNPT